MFDTKQRGGLNSVSSLAGGIAHDFNNILSLLDGYARMASARLEEGDLQACKTYIDNIHMATQRGTNLTRKLLLFGDRKISGNKVVDLQKVMQDLQNISMGTMNPNITLFVHCYDNARIECPPDLFMDALSGIIENSCQAMPERGGSIFIETRMCDVVMLPSEIRSQIEGGDTAKQFILLTIADTGIGMSQEVLERAVEPFFSTKSHGTSSGFGLSVVYGLAKQMGASFKIDSAENQGTTVSLYLPVYTGKEAVKSMLVDGSAADICFDGYTVLVADDEVELLEIVGDELSRLGFNVLKAVNGNDALDKQDVYEGDIDILMTDIVMPELNGVRLSQLMQSVRPEVRTVFMSGFPAGSNLEEIEFPQDADILAKPLQFDVLPEVMRQALTKGNGSSTYGQLNKGDAVWEF